MKLAFLFCCFVFQNQNKVRTDCCMIACRFQSFKIITLCIIQSGTEEGHEAAALDEPESSYRSQSCITRDGGGGEYRK